MVVSSMLAGVARAGSAFFRDPLVLAVYQLDLVELPRLSNFDCLRCAGNLPGNTQWM
jgi:hypothetical protein